MRSCLLALFLALLVVAPSQANNNEPPWPMITKLIIGQTEVHPWTYTYLSPDQVAVATWSLHPELQPNAWSCTYDPSLLTINEVQPAPQQTADGFTTTPSATLHVTFTTPPQTIRRDALLICYTDTNEARYYAHVSVAVVPPVQVYLPVAVH